MQSIRIGLISDTHGLLRPQALAALADTQVILHAGDIGDPDIIDALGRIAPVHAVRGNNDTAPWTQCFAETLQLEAEGVLLYMLHDVKTLAVDPAAAGIRMVIAGHSHRPLILEKNGVLFVNPGSAGPRRFRLPVSVGYIDIVDGKATAQIRMLDIA